MYGSGGYGGIRYNEAGINKDDRWVYENREFRIWYWVFKRIVVPGWAGSALVLYWGCSVLAPPVI